MENKKLRKIVINGLMIAVVFLTTYLTKIPGLIPQTYINLGDAAIIVAALVFGRKNGFYAGAIGSALADLALGSILFVPITFIVKGLEGFVMGFLAERLREKKYGKVLSIVVGMSIMVGGYFIAEAAVLSLFTDGFGFVVALGDVQLNLIQAGACAVVGYTLVKVLSKKLAPYI